MRKKLKPIVGIPLLLAVIVLTGGGCLHRNHHSAYRDIHGIARSGKVEEVVAVLEQHPDDLNRPDDAGFTPLHLAASHCRTEVVVLLLDRGAMIDCRAKDGTTPLHLAAQGGCVDTVNLLLKRGARLEARDNQGRSSLDRARLWHQEQVVRLIEDYMRGNEHH
jgi:ankyrin repeat protein